MDPLFVLYKLAGSLAVPPGLFVLCSALLGTVLLRRPRRPFCALLAFLLSGGIWFFSTPFGDRLVTAPLEVSVSPDLPPPGTPAAVAVLAGGARYGKDEVPTDPGPWSLQRALEGWLLARRHGWPLYLSGGRVREGGKGSEAGIMAEALRRIDPSADLRVEGRSRTTWENLANLAPLLRASGTKDLVLVTSAFHMPRSLATARRALPGIRVHPYPVGLLVDATPLKALDFVPLSMNVCTLGIRERLGLRAYRIYSFFSVGSSKTSSSNDSR
jgi:uncharacterized SAM-binding protein YcdF (DUF218 family)